MFIYKVIYSKLVGDTDVNAIVSGRVRPEVLDQDDTLPAITYTTIDSLPDDTKDGASTLDVVEVDVDFWGKAEAGIDPLKDLANKARTVLERFTGTVEGVVIDGIRFKGEESDFSEISQKGVYHITHTYSIREKL